MDDRKETMERKGKQEEKTISCRGFHALRLSYFHRLFLGGRCVATLNWARIALRR
ncbi:hypothetical protein HRbin17_00825 [bacterium HR17]|uniref:Uncharacterized protein n=1 Tax=Candidatus Fervidibacter japonicus TaxID=2035412 RepID=A0A2H5XAW1_9BACT|nr:hypothetical protein HRbin17_00825 [bacterium HR17]